MPDLGEHRERVDRALRAPLGPRWDAWPGAALDPGLDPETRLSALLLLLSSDDPPHDVVDRVRRQRLPWDAASAATALDLARGRPDFDDLGVGIALGAAHRVCSAGRADARLVDALTATRDWLDGLPVHRWRVPDMQTRVRRVLAAAAPPALLDLSLVRDGDDWGGPARRLARDLPSDEVAPLVRLLGDLGPKLPPTAWQAAIRDAVRPEGARALVLGWLRLVPTTDAPALTPGNDDLVRATVLAARGLEDERVPPLLGTLARRSTIAIATAALDALGARGATADRTELRSLLRGHDRRDLAARAALLLDGLVRPQPAPRASRAATGALVRRHLTPLLHEHGFAGTGTSLRRRHAEHFDLVAVGVAGGRLRLTYGVRFDAAHPADEPWHVPSLKARDVDLDIRLVEDAAADEAGVLALADRLADVVTLLDDLAGYAAARDHLRHGSRLTKGATDLSDPGSPRAAGVLGLLALDMGDQETAVEMLSRRVAFEESRDRSDELAFWRDRLVRARR